MFWIRSSKSKHRGFIRIRKPGIKGGTAYKKRDEVLKRLGFASYGEYRSWWNAITAN